MKPHLIVVYLVILLTSTRGFAGDAKPATGATTEPAAGHWEGTIEIPGMQLGVVVELKRDQKAGWAGKIDIPMQGAHGLPLVNVKVEGPNVAFSIKGIQGAPTFDGVLNANLSIEGTFSQGGMKMPFSLTRDKVVTGALVRPQEPKPPFPYQEKSVTFDVQGARLAGTLTIPGEPGAAAPSGGFPAVILVTGSGPQNRDEELFGHKPFKLLADQLTRAGIAVLRIDDRGTGESSGEFADCTSDDFAKDLEAAIAYLKTSAAVPVRTIGLIGHSEGAMIASIVGARNGDVKFVVMLAPPGVVGNEVLSRQLEQFLRAGGAGDSEVAKAVETQREILSALRDAKTKEEAAPRLAEALKKQYETLPAPTRSAMGDPEEFVKTQLEAVNTNWMRYFVSFDPRPELRELKKPAVLALWGALDLQVDPEQNMPEVEEALNQSGNESVTLKKLDGLNHLFQPAGKGTIDEYSTIETTMDEKALKEIVEWIVKQSGK